MTLRSVFSFSLCVAASVAVAQFSPARPLAVHECLPAYPGDNIYVTQYADLDGDGHEDILRRSDWSTARLVWQRWVPGGFAPAEILGEQMPFLWDVRTGDVDGNGWTDIVIGSARGYQIIPNTGYGVFGPSQYVADDRDTDGGVLLADLTGDGLLDLFTSSLDASNIKLIFPNQGGATFGEPLSITVDEGYIPGDLIDMDADGDLDLVALYPVAWYANDGSGTFGPVQVIDDGAVQLYLPRIKDATGDGLPDFTYANATDEGFIRVNNGDGTFGPEHPLDANTRLEVYAPDKGDVDGDGDLDLANDYGIYYNDGGSYAFMGWIWVTQDGRSYGSNHFADVDGDGDLDVIGANQLDGLGWHENLGGGLFDTYNTGTPIYNSYEAPLAMSAVDVDADGDLDILCPTGGHVTNDMGETPMWLQNDGAGHFSAPTIFDDSIHSAWVDLKDMDGDGSLDLVYAKDDSIRWLPHPITPDMNDARFATTFQMPWSAAPATILDIDGDGDQDIVLNQYINGDASYSTDAVLNDGTGHFSAWAAFDAQIGEGLLGWGDLDGNGLPDVARLDENGHYTHVLMQQGPLVFTEVAAPGSPSEHLGLAVMDDTLIFFGSDEGLMWAAYNAASGTLGVPAIIPDLPTGPFSLNDLNGDGGKELMTVDPFGWYERTGPISFGTFVAMHSAADPASGYVVANIDGQGQPDLVVRSTQRKALVWQENISDGFFRMAGHVFLDVDQDGVRDVDEPAMANFPVIADDPYWQAMPDTLGRYYVYTPPGTHSIHVQAPAPWMGMPATRTATVDASAPYVDDLDFPIVAAYDTTAFELWSSFAPVVCTDPFRKFTFGVSNGGTTRPPSRLDLFIPYSYLLDSVVPAPNEWHGDTAVWYFNAPVFSRSVQMSIYYPFWLHWLFAEIHATLNVQDDGGQYVPFVSDSWEARYVCGMDPNDKSVHPEGTGPLHAVDLAIPRLTYTIRFQNTGTAPTQDVMIRDPLSSDLDWGSLHVLGSSHTITTTQVEDDGELVFRFDGIQLPDSASDREGSHGFVTFSLAPKNGVQNETRIENTAGIYFDQNDPVITNTTLTTLVDCDLFPVTITDEAGGILQASGGDHYQWFLNGDSIIGASSDALLVTGPGDYTVQMSNRYGCTRTSDVHTVLSVGMVGIASDGVALMPNPAHDGVRVFSSQVLENTDRIVLLDLNGRILRTIAGNGTRELTLERGNLSDGLYVVRILCNGAQIGIARVVFE